MVIFRFHNISASALLPETGYTRVTKRAVKGGNNMTANTVAYAKVLEDRRHNVASEGISRGTLEETKRSNRVQQGINWYSAQNLAQLQASQGKAALMQGGASVMQARAATSQAESARSQADTAKRRADTAQYEADTKRGSAIVSGVKTGSDIIAGVFDRAVSVGLMRFGGASRTIGFGSR